MLYNVILLKDECNEIYIKKICIWEGYLKSMLVCRCEIFFYIK